MAALTSHRTWLWILAPVALSAGVLWLSAEDTKPAGPADLKVGELAERLQAKEKALGLKEQELLKLQERLATLQSTLDRDRQDLQAREKALQEAQAKLEKERTRPDVDPKVIRTYEAMEPALAAKALTELHAQNPDMAISILGSMPPKKVAKLMEQVEAKLAARLLERVGLTREKAKVAS